MGPSTTISTSLLLIAIACFAACSLFETDPVEPTEARTISTAKSGIKEPFGLAFKDGETFVSDGQKGVIWKIDARNRLTEYARGFSTPSHIDFDSSGNLYVADSGDHTVKKISPEGVVELVAGVPGRRGSRNGNSESALFNSPVGIAVRGETIFIADTYNDRIRIIEDGKVRTLSGGNRGLAEGSGGKFDTPTGLAVTEEYVLVADTGNKRVRIIAKDGSVSTLAGGGAPGSEGLLAEAAFSSPVDIAVNRDGTIFVTDGDRLRAIGRGMVPIVFTVSGGDRGFRDGALGRARYNRLSGLSLAPNGDIYVADSDNSLIRVLTGNQTGNMLSKKDFELSQASISEFRKNGPARWPYKPADRTREIAGTLGEIRGEIEDLRSQAWFHNGLDITGAFGETAYVVRDEKILLPVAIGEFGTKRENVRFPQLGYIHITVGRDASGKPYEDERFQFSLNGEGTPTGLRISRGSTFKSGDPIGSLNSMNHVHLIAGYRGREFNPLGALRLPGVSDSSEPVIEKIRLVTRQWGEIETVSGEFRIKLGAQIRLVVTAFDRMDGNADRRRLGLYKMGYQFLQVDGSPPTPESGPEWTLFFRRTPPYRAVNLVYSPGSQSGATGKTVFNYIVSNEVRGNYYRESFLKLPDKAGSYILRVFAADFFQNTASKDIKVTIQ